jgi:hypothetical protein
MLAVGKLLKERSRIILFNGIAALYALNSDLGTGIFLPSELQDTPARTVLRLAVRGIAGEGRLRLGIFRSREMGRV